jgi:hypothetical protein
MYLQVYEFQGVAFDHLHGSLCPDSEDSNPLRNVLNNTSLPVTSNELETSSPHAVGCLHEVTLCLLQECSAPVHAQFAAQDEAQCLATHLADSDRCKRNRVCLRCYVHKGNTYVPDIFVIISLKVRNERLFIIVRCSKKICRSLMAVFHKLLRSHAYEVQLRRAIKENYPPLKCQICRFSVKWSRWGVFCGTNIFHRCLSSR